ncbi:unnamed protein product [Caenorhabditis auriculariae]|uniref:Pseudouridine synthase RsuA/RluA-like domain-containing protein n=1 Tax=Caenorhabditis auriculariae TaxID=2777116 RepID=A0A8S1HUS2_9PELO|nr:unnamed protein product [Caenorhabditis auriculariae]
MEVLPDDEESGLETKPLNGIQEIRSRLPPLWELKLDQLAEFMANRVLYNDGEIIAFDKPFGMAYSGSKENRPQFDRILQAVKAKVAPKCERLYVVRAPPKDESGVMVFAKSASVQSVLQGQIKDGLSQQVYRTIVRGVLPKDDLTIDIPLIKRVEGGDMKMIQLKSNNQRGEILYVKTNCKTITRDKYISQLEAVTTAEVSHQVRAHLGYSKCPLIGEPKYISTSPRPPKLPNYTLGLLNISENHTRKLPMFLHCKQVTYQPLRANAEPIRIGVPVPDHFNFVLKRLRILKKAARFLIFFYRNYYINIENMELCISDDGEEPLPSSSELSKDLGQGDATPNLGRIAKVIRWTSKSSSESRDFLQVASAANEDPELRAKFMEKVRAFYGVDKAQKIVLKFSLKKLPVEGLDLKWERRMQYLYRRFLELEKLLWNLSTLGGAYSAMGDYDLKFAETAAEISRKQLKIAHEIGDPTIVARCHLYQALADAQRGDFQKALKIVKAMYSWAVKVDHNELVEACARGVARKIVAIQKLGTVALPAAKMAM